MPDIAQVLRAVSPKADPAFIAASSNAGAIMRDYGITSLNAQTQLIGHMAVECAGFTKFEESLNYSAKRLMQVWPKRFPTLESARVCANNPKVLANRVYDGRMGNVSGSNDGWTYRGSGGLQHTGKAEFERVKARTGRDVVNNPDLLRRAPDAEVMWRGACSYFVDRGALAGANRGDTNAVCVKVNGGTTGLSDRKIMVQRAEHAFMGETLVVVEKTTHEDSEDSRKTAKTVTTAAPAAGAASGGSSKSADADWSDAIVIGLGVMLAIGMLAIVLWRRHASKLAIVQTQQMQTIDSRLMPQIEPIPAA